MQNEAQQHFQHLAAVQEAQAATTAPPSTTAIRPMMMPPASIGIISVEMQNEAQQHVRHLATVQEAQAGTIVPPSTAAIHPMMMSPASIGITFPQLGTQGYGIPVPSILVCIPPENTVFVNRRQYHRIEKRREARRVLNAYYERCRQGKTRPNPNYVHESRHRHAQNRPRNRKGHFMKGPELEEYYRLNPDKAPNNKKEKSSTEEDSSS